MGRATGASKYTNFIRRTTGDRGTTPSRKHAKQLPPGKEAGDAFYARPGRPTSPLHINEWLTSPGIASLPKPP